MIRENDDVGVKNKGKKGKKQQNEPHGREEQKVKDNQGGAGDQLDEDGSEPGDQVVNQNQYVNHGDRHIPVTGVSNAMAEGLTSNKPRPGRRSATINAASVLFLVLW